LEEIIASIFMAEVSPEDGGSIFLRMLAYSQIMKIIAVWVVTPCNLVRVCRGFGGAYCLHYQGDGGGSKHL
jgi:hypothetical protein